jgi:reverse gyrase
MSENYRKALENLDLFLADTEAQTAEEIAKELKDQGVDVEEFLSKVKSVVRKGYQGQVRAAAAGKEATW